MHFIRLIRPLNLIIIALTMYGLGWYFDPMEGCSCTYIVTDWPFFWLVFSTVLIAAGGNIINDYFDVRADRVNKPHRLIITKHIKKRTAIVMHWTINLIAFSIALYLSWIMDSFWYLFIHLFSINVLWFYSMYFKRQFLTGNVLIAALTALVPVLVGIFFYQQNLANTEWYNMELFPFNLNGSTPRIIMYISLGLAIFAFLLNLAREVIKDMEDVDGDKKLHAKTLPISWGYKKSKWFVGISLFAAICAAGMLIYLIEAFTIMTVLPGIIAAILILIAIILVSSASTKSDYRRINHCLKLAMTVGLLTPVYWKIISTYVQF
ncbi:MAG: geranylgeranylglycerol-phosphate geranylgeranyltransferase [Crocinitomicaceae bacterium]|nr:geranylgeranylglycerol-phosphate geranylgeranyltransferase [Flavobacteriales bacterium]NQZ35219.1 geranylgeranylglycerol-phosphate geranylgeranyltransferase [Crocinitomicaceae bacterium]